MVTFLTGKFQEVLVCKSSDTKPEVNELGIPLINGSLLYEMDTKTFYMWDAAGETWIEQ